jgi:spore coat protein U-like protein
MKYTSFAFALGFLALGLASRPALPATATASFSVTVTVQSACQVSVPATAFGTYAAAGVNAASSVSVTCTNPTPYNVNLSAGLASSATATARETAGPTSDALSHAALPDSAHTVNWGRLAGAAGNGSGSFHPHTGYGQAAWAQYVTPGALADSVTVAVTY